MNCFFFSLASFPAGTDFAMAIQAKNLKKVDKEAEKKRREDFNNNRCKNYLFSVTSIATRQLRH